MRPRVTAYMEDLVVHPNAQTTGVGERFLRRHTGWLPPGRGFAEAEGVDIQQECAGILWAYGDASAQRDHGDAVCGDWEFSTEL